MTLSEIEPATFRCLNQLRHRVPQSVNYVQASAYYMRIVSKTYLYCVGKVHSDRASALRRGRQHFVVVLWFEVLADVPLQ